MKKIENIGDINQFFESVKRLHDSYLFKFKYHKNQNIIELTFCSTWVQNKNITLIFSDIQYAKLNIDAKSDYIIYDAKLFLTDGLYEFEDNDRNICIKSKSVSVA